MSRLLAAAVLAAACVAGTGGSASAYHRCSATVDRECTYCSYAGGQQPQNEWYCDNNIGNWRYESCQLWVAGWCYLN